MTDPGDRDGSDERAALHPLAQTAEAVRQLDQDGDSDLAASLSELAARVLDVVPQCVGMSVGLHAHGVTLTLASTAVGLQLIDGVQYVSSGPCVVAAETGETRIARSDDPLDEEGWALFARATAHEGVQSTLSLVLLDHDAVVGGLNLYAATPDAFDGKVELLAPMVRAQVGQAVLNADLDFSSRLRATEAPGVLARGQIIDQATGVLAARLGLGIDQAFDRLHDAASRAGVPVAALAKLLVEIDVE